MIPEYLLPVLRLRRQAAARGWRLVRVAPTRRGRTFRYERDDNGWDRDGGWAHVRPSWYGHHIGDYTPLRISVNSPDGFLVAEHIGDGQAAAVVRALLGWPLPEVDEEPWPPRSKALVPAELYRAGAL